MTTEKTIALTRWTFVGKVMSLLLNMLSRLVITFLPRSKHLLISWLQSPSAVILEPPKIKLTTVSTVSPSVCHEVMGPDPMILVYWMLSLKPTFLLSSFTFIKKLWVLNANQKPSHLNHNYFFKEQLIVFHCGPIHTYIYVYLHIFILCRFCVCVYRCILLVKSVLKITSQFPVFMIKAVPSHQ